MKHYIKGIAIYVMVAFYSVSMADTQSESFIDYIGYDTIADELRMSQNDIEQYKPLIGKIQEKEEEFQDTHYAFYNAKLKDSMIIQDLYKELLSALEGVEWKDFEFLRAVDRLYSGDLSNFFQMFDKLEDQTDHNPKVRSLLTAVNLSFPGNLEHAESTFYYFHDPVSQIASPEYEKTYENFLKTVIDQFRGSVLLDNEFIQAKIKSLKDLRNYFEGTKQGLLMQIFIPKELVDNFVYLSSDYGVPWGRRDFEIGEKELINTFPKAWSEDKKRFIQISPILEAYKNEPDKIGEDAMLEMQARILYGDKLFSSPASGVKIFRYDMIDKDNINEYKKALASIVSDIVGEIISKK